MNEGEWLSCTDLQKMLAFLDGKVTRRKLRLFACACFRRRWELLTDHRDRAVVKLAELDGDGMIGGGKVERAFMRAGWGYDARRGFLSVNWTRDAGLVARQYLEVFGPDGDGRERAARADLLRDL